LGKEAVKFIMALFTGTDIIEISRIRQALDHWGDKFLQRVFTGAEIEYFGAKPEALAARFAGKEAVMKLLGTGANGVGWRDIETLFYSSGKPKLNLYGRAKITADNLGIREIDISLSHSREYAIATAVGIG
jgi:holo-[acyl-carrier protein] synthase